MARVLVTGGSGFIGLHLVETLGALGDEVTCLVRHRSQVEPLKQLGVRLAIGDVTQPDTLPPAIATADVVYHLAGRNLANNQTEYNTTNQDGVEHLLAACAARPSPPTVVLVSSLSAAGPAAQDRPRTETDLPQPVSEYGKSKRSGELAAEAWAHRLPITVLRPPIVIGPRDRMGLTLFRAIRRVRAFSVLGRGRQVSLIHVADLVAAMLAAAQRGERLPSAQQSEPAVADGRDPGRGYYFIAADERPWFVELSRWVARAVGRPGAWAIRVPEAAVWLVGGCGELLGRITGRARYLNLDRAREITAGHWTCSAEKARRQLQFSPAAPLEDRVHQTAQWYFDHGWI